MVTEVVPLNTPDLAGVMLESQDAFLISGRPNLYLLVCRRGYKIGSKVRVS